MVAALWLYQTVILNLFQDPLIIRTVPVCGTVDAETSSA
jgi:hypothetical protein